MFFLLAYVLGFLAMFGISADTSSPAMSAAVGSGARSVRQAIILIAIFAVIGSVAEGWKVQKTLGEGLIDLGSSSGSLPTYVVLAILMTISLNLVIEVYVLKFLPIPTSYVTVGAMVGVGLLFSYNINWLTLSKLAVGWIVTPFMAGFLAIFIYYYIVPILNLRIRDPMKRYRVYMILLTVSGCFTAYTIGANHVGFVTGPLVAAGGEPTLSLVVALSGVVLGPIMLGGRFIRKIGHGITRLTPASALSAELAAALTIETMTQFGLPVSLNEAILAAIVAIGISTSIKSTKTDFIKKIVIGWPLALVMSGFMAAGLSLVFRMMIP